MTLVVERLEALVIARAHTAAGKLAPGELVKPLSRFAPVELTPAAWRERLAEVMAGLVAHGVLDADHRVRDAGELARRIGAAVDSWPELSDRVLPALAVGIAAGEAKLRARLDSRDAWAAAIVGRSLGLWRDHGAPPTLAAVCDALAWRELGLPGAPKRCPREIRALFMQRRLDDQREAGSPERLVRVLAAREVGAPRPELRALRDALVRGWLAGQDVGAAGRSAAAAPEPPAIRETGNGASRATPAAREANSASFVEAVLRAADAVVDGWFGDRKVFVSAVWDELRRDPRWAELGLAEFKAHLVAAHRAGELALARADLVAAMDPALVAASETAADGASFHFLVKERAT